MTERLTDTPENPVPDLSSTSALAPFRHGVYRNIWVGSLGSNLGSQIQAVGAAWLMTSLTTSADLVALVQASTTLPIVIFSLASGAIADNFDRRRVMLAAQAFMLAVSLLLAATAWFGAISPWLLLAFTFLIGCGTALNNPSWQASVGEMVPRDTLPAAVALNSVNFNLTRSVGPAIGGLIVAGAGAATAFLFNALSYLPLLWVISRWKTSPVKRTTPPETLGHAMTLGLRYVAMSPNIEKVLLRGFVFGFASIVILAMLPLVARDLPEGGPLLFGLLLGCFGVGAVAGAFIGARARELWPNETVARAAFVGYAAAVAIIAFADRAWIAGIGAAIGGIGWVMALSMFNVTVQLSTPRWVLGRALALYQTATFGGMALGAWIWGLVAEAHSPGTALTAASAVLLVGAAIGLKLPLPVKPSENLDPANRWREPNVLLDLQGRSGPVNVLIEYVVRDQDTEAFLDAMNERRRIRRRDGARQWELLRDAEHPEQWMESYHVPTWDEYQRHVQRRTLADSVVDDRIRALHAGSEPPRVHRMLVRPTRPAQPGLQTKTPVDLG